MFEFIRADLRRKQEHYVLVPNFVNRFLKIPFQFGTFAVVLYRFGYWAYQCKWPLLRQILIVLYWLSYYPLTRIIGIEINVKQAIGKGFVIHNFSTIVIDAEHIGDSLTVNQDVTIGEDWKHNGKPCLGNNVFVGSGAKILGAIHIGDNVVIAANALVHKNIDNDCVVVGNPGMVIQRNLNKDYISSVPVRKI